MKNRQKYIYLLLILTLISLVFALLRDIYLAQTSGASDIPLIAKNNWESLSLFFGFMAVGISYLACIYQRQKAEQHNQHRSLKSRARITRVRYCNARPEFN